MYKILTSVAAKGFIIWPTVITIGMVLFPLGMLTFTSPERSAPLTLGGLALLVGGCMAVFFYFSRNR